MKVHRIMSQPIISFSLQALLPSLINSKGIKLRSLPSLSFLSFPSLPLPSPSSLYPSQHGFLPPHPESAYHALLLTTCPACPTFYSKISICFAVFLISIIEINGISCCFVLSMRHGLEFCTV